MTLPKTEEDCNKNNDVVQYYAVGKKERLYATSIKDAVLEYLSDLSVEQYHETVEVQGYRVKKLPANFFDEDDLEDMLERLDYDYGDPDGDPSDASEAMKVAFKHLNDVIVAEYNVSSCEAYGDCITVRVEDYVSIKTYD